MARLRQVWSVSVYHGRRRWKKKRSKKKKRGGRGGDGGRAGGEEAYQKPCWCMVSGGEAGGGRWQCSKEEGEVECCICLTSYEDGVELHALPCNHHFHSSCIVKWLRIHANCPLCKYNILKGSDIV